MIFCDQTFQDVQVKVLQEKHIQIQELIFSGKTSSAEQRNKRGSISTLADHSQNINHQQSF